MDWVATCCGERYLILQTATNSHLPFTLHFSLLKLLAWISHWYLNMLPQRRPYKSRGGETTKTPNSLQEKKLLWCSWRPFSGFIHGSTPVGGSEKSLCACTLRKRSFPSLPLFSYLVPIYVCWYLFVHFIQSSRVNSHTFKLQKKCKIKYCSVLSTISEGFVFFSQGWRRQLSQTHDFCFCFLCLDIAMWIKARFFQKSYLFMLMFAKVA